MKLFQEDILEQVWEALMSLTIIDNHITALRKKVSSHGMSIESIYGEGYQLIINSSDYINRNPLFGYFSL